MKQLKTLASSIFLAVVFFGLQASAANYTLKGTVDSKYNDKAVLLISLSQGDTIGRTTVTDQAFILEGNVEAPILAQLRIGGRSNGNLVIEPGVISFDKGMASGTKLNDILADFGRLQQQTMDEYNALQQQMATDPQAKEKMEKLARTYQDFTDNLMITNIDNPVGASILLDEAYGMNYEQLDSMMTAYPSLAGYSKLNQIRSHKKIASETSEGKPYKDFTIEYNGTSTKLSDLMKPGRYTLVDFWASWCGPCRREIPVIQELWKEYRDKGLDVIGVAVWDEPDATANAVEELAIEWPIIYNAQTIPTDLYGILGIPSIILINPDGVIVSRDKQDDELRQAVIDAISNN